MDHADWCFLLRVVTNIASNFDTQKYRSLNRAQIKSEQVLDYLVNKLGFNPSGALLVMHEGATTREELQNQIVPEIQKQVDITRDPEGISFAQVAEILGRDGNLPGIETNIDETSLGNWNELPAMEPPRKPWHSVTAD